MTRLSWLFFALFSSALLLGAQVWILAEDLFWTHRWIDIPMHMWGGLTLGALGIGLLGRHQPLVFFVFVAVMVVGWEVFEHVHDFAIVEDEPYWLDTIHDLVNGAIGAVVTYVVARKTVWR